MKIRTDFVTNSSSSSFITYLLSDGKEIMEIEFCTIGCEDCEYSDDLQVYEDKMNEEFNAFYRAFRLDEVNNKSTQGKFQTRDELYEKFRDEYEKKNPKPNKTYFLNNLANVRVLNKLLTINSFAEMADLMRIDKERAFCLFSVFDGEKHIEFNSLKEMIELYDKKGFKPETIVFIDGATDTYSAPEKCDNQHKVFEHDGTDKGDFRQVVLDLKNKSLMISDSLHYVLSNEELYGHNDNELLMDDNLMQKRDVYRMCEMWRRQFFKEEMKFKNSNPKRAYFESHYYNCNDED